MDSGVLLAQSINAYRLVALSFRYGSNHSEREIDCARKICSKYGIEHKIIDLPFIKELFKSSLLAGAEAIPEGHYEAESMKSTIVPFRNGIMLAIATGYAESIGAEWILIGNHAGDHYIYPDCRTEFINSMNDAIREGTLSGIELLSPFCDKTKRDIGLIGQGLDFDFRDSYSCYKGGSKHCGKCGSCNERREALNGFDPTDYE